MTTSRLTPPPALDLVSADRVRDMIAQADAELSALEHDAKETKSAADRAESAVRDAGLDPEASAWTMVRLQRFLDGLRDETHRDVDTILELARQQGRFRLSEVGASDRRIADAPTAAPRVATTPAAPAADAPASVAAPSSPPAAPGAPSTPIVSAPAATVTPPPTPMPWPDADPPRASGPNHVAAVAVASVPSVPEPEPAVPYLALVEDAPGDPTVDRFAPLPESPVAAAAPPLAPTPAPSPVVAAPAPVAPVPVTPTPQPAPAPAPAPVAKRKTGLRRLPVSAMLEVVAVLLILVFILLRLS